MANRSLPLFNAVLIPTLLCLLAIHSASAKEPVYDGKALSEWLGEPNKGVRYDAIRQIGTNGIPPLLDILGVKERNVKRVVSKLQNKQLQDFTSKDADFEDLRSLAVDGFAALGTNAEPAIPRIVKMLKDGEVSFQAARALSKIGPMGFSALTNALAGEDSSIRNNVIFALSQGGGTDPKLITQLLINSLKDSDWAVRGNAADFLAGKNSELAIPVLITMLDDPAYYPRNRAADTLGSFGPAAKNAVPKLFSTFTNVISGSDKGLAFALGGSLLDALKKIDPETAGRAYVYLFDAPLGVSGYGWTTTKLTNGKELISGGRIYTKIPTLTSHVFARAQLYDPASGKTTETGSMNVARDVHTATLLKNGKVLVVGGEDGKNKALSSAELYDPATGRWTLTCPMNASHYSNTAVLLPNGNVLVFSGGRNGSPIHDQERYDPTTGTWTVVTDLMSVPK